MFVLTLFYFLKKDENIEYKSWNVRIQFVFCHKNTTKMPNSTQEYLIGQIKLKDNKSEKN